MQARAESAIAPSEEAARPPRHHHHLVLRGLLETLSIRVYAHIESFGRVHSESVA